MSELPHARIVRLGGATRPDVPARRIPLLVRWSLRLRGGGMVLGWLFGGFALLACLAIIPRVDVYPQQLETATGTVLATGVQLSVVEFQAADGTTHLRQDPRWLVVGESIPVAYDVADPDREPRDRSHRFGPYSLILLAFPGAVFVCLALMMRFDPRRILRLLRHGHPAVARLTPRKPFGPGFDMSEYEYEVNGDRRRLEVASSRRRIAPETIHIVYDPADAEQALSLNDLPGQPRVEADRITLTARIAWGPFVLPTIVALQAVLLAVLSLR